MQFLQKLGSRPERPFQGCTELTGTLKAEGSSPRLKTVERDPRTVKRPQSVLSCFWLVERGVCEAVHELVNCSLRCTVGSV